ncbi:MAG: radical SAM protein [Tissierellia bacterium]|nr:radical SAM protein [Tissierellia bacterium]
MAIKAEYYKSMEGGVQCLLCPHRCRLKSGQLGICKARICRGVDLYSLSDGVITSMGYDPLEKKPLTHFMKGSIFSIGSFGCNFHCDFCQNYRLLDPQAPQIKVQDRDLLEAAAAQGSLGIAYTYNEPTVNFEMVKRLSKKIHGQNQVNVMITNGYIERDPRRELLGLIDAWNIDYKMPRELYPGICGGKEEVVLETIKEASLHSHVEVSTLLIPGRNTGEDVFRGMMKKLSEINDEIPLHLSRYFPCYKCSIPETSLETMLLCEKIAKEYMKTVELGNMPLYY